MRESGFGYLRAKTYVRKFCHGDLPLSMQWHGNCITSKVDYIVMSSGKAFYLIMIGSLMNQTKCDGAPLVSYYNKTILFSLQIWYGLYLLCVIIASALVYPFPFYIHIWTQWQMWHMMHHDKWMLPKSFTFYIFGTILTACLLCPWVWHNIMQGTRIHTWICSHTWAIQSHFFFFSFHSAPRERNWIFMTDEWNNMK